MVLEDLRKEIKSLLNLVIRNDVGPNTIDFVVDELVSMMTSTSATRCIPLAEDDVS